MDLSNNLVYQSKIEQLGGQIKRRGEREKNCNYLIIDYKIYAIMHIQQTSLLFSACTLRMGEKLIEA